MDFHSDADLIQQIVKCYGGIAYDHESLPRVVAVHALGCDPDHDAGLSSSEYSMLLHKKGKQWNPIFGTPKKCFSMLIGIRNKSHSEKPSMNLNGHVKATSEKTDRADLCQLPQRLSVEKSKAIGFGNGIAGNLTAEEGVRMKHGSNHSWQVTNTSVISSGSETSETSSTAMARSCSSEDQLGSVGSASNTNDRIIKFQDKTNNMNWSNIAMVTNATRCCGHYVPIKLTVVNQQCVENISTTSSDHSVADKGTSTVDLLKWQVESSATENNTVNGKEKSETNIVDSPGEGQKLKKAKLDCGGNDHDAFEHSNKGSNEPKQKVVQPASDSYRKRPRKSFPRKALLAKDWILEEEINECRSSDSEKTLSSDEWDTVKSDPNVPVQVTRVDIEPCTGKDTGVFTGAIHSKSTAGEWREFTQSTDTDRGICSDQQPTTFCVFTDRRIASLTPLTQTVDNLDLPPSLDREARIKELLSKQEKLLTQMRRERAGTHSS